MSYDIIYRRRAFFLNATQAGHHDDVYFLLEEAGSNNCYELNNRRRSRNWCCTAAGDKWECLAEVTHCAASCCGGSLVLTGRGTTTPEAYIRTWRNSLSKAAPFEEAGKMGFGLQLFTRIAPEEVNNANVQFAFDRLIKHALVFPGAYTDPFTHKTSREWRFDAAVPEQVKLWLETRKSGRGFHSVEVTGPVR